MRHPVLTGLIWAGLLGTSSAQTPTQPTGSVQTGEAVAPRAPIAATRSISSEGLSGDQRGAAGGKQSDSGPQPWKDVMGWLGLKQGMSPDEVKALMGPDYRESVNAEGKLWSYQDSKALLYGSISFKDDKVDDWVSPRF